MEKNSISKIVPILLSIYYTINLSSIIYSSIIMKDFSKIAWIVPSICLIIFIILIILYKPVNFLDYVNKNKIFQLFLGIYILINNILILYTSTSFLSFAFFKISTIYLFLILNIIGITLLSLFNLEQIMRLGLILSFSSLIILPILLDVEFINQPYLDILPDNIPFNLIKSIYFITTYFEIIIYTIFNDYYSNPLSKKSLIFSAFFITIIITLQIIDSYTIVNYRYYESSRVLSLNRYFAHTGKRYFEHLDILLLYIILSTTFYKIPFNNIIFKTNKKHQLLIVLLGSIIICGITLFIINYKEIFSILFMINSIITIILFIFIIIISRRVKNVRKHQN